MIRATTVTPTVLSPDVSASALSRIGDSLAGPGRTLDPVEAMAADIAEIAGSGLGVDEPALKSRGWTAAEIVEHWPDAVKRARGVVGADA